MSGYVLDDLALIAGLAAEGSEHHRRELSRLLHGAIDGVHYSTFLRSA